MELNDVSGRVNGYIRGNFLIGRPADYLKETESMLEKGVLDSTGILEVVGFLEETFGIKVEDEEMVPENLETINNIIRYLQRKLGMAV